ncbi:MAG: O-antigen ligase family protein [Chloroflexi bacterium]|nr:O-antigen ligase family protein [Chloroflexota bacterium]
MPTLSRSERIQRLGVILIVLYISLIGGTYYSDFYFFLNIIFEVVVTAVLAGWLISSLRKGRLWPHTPLDTVLAVSAGWLIITSLLSRDVRVSVEGLWRFLVHFMTFYLLIDLMRRGRQRWVMEALALTGGVIVLVSALEMISWYIGLGFGGFTQGWITIDGAGFIPPYLHRLTLALNNSTVLGNWVALVLPVTFCWGLTATQRDNRLGLMLLSIGLLGVEFLALSRGGWLATFVAGAMLAAFWLYRWSARSTKYPPKVVMPLAIGGFVIAFIGLLVIASVVRGTSVIDQDKGRLDMWNSAIEMTIDHPLTGFGMRQFGAVSREYRDSSIDDNQLATAHNIVLNVSSETGIPGLLILLWLVAAYLQAWRKEWQTADRARKIRLEGILAALVGLAINSMVDAFILTTSTLPILILAAYTFAGKYTPENPAPSQAPTSTTRYLRPIALGVVVLYAAWFIPINMANVQFARSIIAAQKDDLDTALDRAESARNLDPALGLYDFQYAYVLGLLAEDQPEQYLDKAIQAHEDALADYPTFDVAQANLAALYRQKGNLPKAADHLQLAIDNNSYKAEYHLLLGQVIEEQAVAARQNPLDTTAAADYREALRLDVRLAQSAFWDQGEEYTARILALNVFYRQTSTTNRFLIAAYRGFQQPAVVGSTNEASTNAKEAAAKGEYAVSQRNYQQAIEWFTKAIELDGGLVSAYVGRAEANYQLGNLDDAEGDAQKALFVVPADAARANYVLALVKMRREDVPADNELFNEQLADSVQPRIQTEYFAQVTFLRPGAFDYLPQLPAIGRDTGYYAGWFLLAERYAADDDPATDPKDVYEAILEQDPYVQEARDLLNQ